MAKTKRASTGVDPAAWATVDLSKIASKKLRRYLEERRKAAAAEAAAAG